MKRFIKEKLEVVQVLDVVDIGVTCPVRCRLSDGSIGIVKYQKNPFGNIVLINELIGSMIADEIGLQIPEYGICNLSEDVINDTNNNMEIDYNNSGFSFFTVVHNSSFPIIGKVLRMVSNKQAELIILFDQIVNNYDRHDGNLIIEVLDGLAKLYIIDNSHIIRDFKNETLEYAYSDKCILSDKIQKNNKEVYDKLCFGLGFKIEVLETEAQFIKKVINENFFNRIKDSIPEEWLCNISKEDLNSMFDIIKKRIDNLDKIIDIIKEGRK